MSDYQPSPEDYQRMRAPLSLKYKIWSGVAITLFSLASIAVFGYTLNYSQARNNLKAEQDSIKFEEAFKKAMPEVITLDSVYFAKRDSMKRVYENSLEHKVGNENE